MTRIARLLLAPSLLVSTFAVTAAADVLTLTDGEVLSDVTIVAQGLLQTTYEKGGDEQTIDSERILHVRIDTLPDDLDEAEAALREEDPIAALELLDAFVEENRERVRGRTAKWAPAHAAWRAIEIRRGLSDADGVIATAKVLLETWPESRYAPQAFLAKAEYESRKGDGGASEATLVALDDLARDKGLKRWELASRLARLRNADRAPAEMREAFQNLASSASKYPTVRALARASEAETFLTEAESAQLAEAAALRKQAGELFEQVVADPKADGRALAAAHTGLAECLFFDGAASDDQDVLQAAALHGLRVAVSYRDETDYLPKALFYAFRSFDVRKDRGRKQDMLSELEALFPDSSWTEQARQFR